MSFSSRYSIGLDMDSREIRAVELKGSQKKPVISAWGKVKLPAGVVSEGRVLNPKLLSEHLERLISENGFKGRDVVLGVNNQDIIVRFAVFPKVPEKNIANMIRFQAQQYLPVSLEELELDYIVVGEKKTGEGEFINVLLVGARKKMLGDFIDAFTALHLTLGDIDSTMLALGRAALIGSDGGTFALAGFNNDIGNILIFKDGSLGMARTVSIAQSPAWIASRQSGDQTAEQDMNIIADILFSEIKLSVNYYKMQNNSDINTLFVLGHNSMQKQVAVRLSETTGLQVTIPEPYIELQKDMGRGDQRGAAFDFSACLSLAMRGLKV